MTSEKVSVVLPTSTGPEPSTRPKSTTRRAFVWAGAALLGYHVYNSRLNQLDAQFIESTVAGGITWWACPDITTTECAYLTVPRDYANPQANDTVSIFLRKVPATVAPKDYLGSILINPGGPGGSGSAFAATRGFSFRDMVDGRYDIIGFDPRGDMERIVEALGEDGLNFWGFSYGTILGSTFAAMRPHLVKRMVLDGVSDAESYHTDIYQWGKDGLTDTHKTLSGFFDSCADAGPDRCAFARHPNTTSPSTAADLRSRLEALYTRLRKRPMPVPYSAVGPGILTASDAKLVVFMGLYAPKRWPQLAQAVADAENGDPKAMYENAYGAFADLHPQKGNENVFNRYMEKIGLAVSTSSIMCGDSAPAGWKSFDDFVEYFHELASIGPIGENWALWTGFCRQWEFRPIERYEGPWSTQAGLKKTRFPIVYASLDADPVTPLSAAIKMSEAFGNKSAVLLVQEGFGHCTLAHPSVCTAKILKDYFVKGKVPAPGTHCKPEPGYLFPGNDTKSIATLSAEDQTLWHALEGLSDLGRDFHRPI
ncbi:hypothetical protein FRC06_010377 [Ceratobasidium sp. 370]|nr:hypothetical protein FRC06_010377 [Ceratobasidium sp. 370]